MAIGDAPKPNLENHRKKEGWVYKYPEVKKVVSLQEVRELGLNEEAIKVLEDILQEQIKVVASEGWDEQGEHYEDEEQRQINKTEISFCGEVDYQPGSYNTANNAETGKWKNIGNTYMMTYLYNAGVGFDRNIHIALARK